MADAPAAIPLPPISLPFLERGGTVSLPWYRFLQQIATGAGSGASIAALTAEIEAVASDASKAETDAQTAINLANSAADAAAQNDALSYIAAATSDGIATASDFHPALLPWLGLTPLDRVSLGIKAAGAFVLHDPQTLDFEGAGVTATSQGLAVTLTIPATVSSVAIVTPSIFTNTGGPITTSGTIALGLAAQSANQVFAGPISGAAQVPGFRALVLADIPSLLSLYDAQGAAATAQANAATSAAANYVSYASAQTLTTGQQSQARSNIGAGSGSGTVTSVALTAPSIFSVAGSPITASGALALSLVTQTANQVFAGPSSGAAAAPGFRALVSADIPGSLTITGGSVNGAPIGAATPSTVAATSLSSTGRTILDSTTAGTSIGTTASPAGGGTLVHAASGANINVRGPVSLSTGATLESVNDAQSATAPLEILASTVQITSPLAVKGACTSTGVMAPFAGTYAALVASYPASSYFGGKATVTDSTTVAFNAIISGGGGNVITAWSDGSNWRVG